MNFILSIKKITQIPAILLIAGIFVSCVNDLESIKKVTYDPKSPDEVTKDLKVFYTDSGYARIELTATLAETYSQPESIMKLKDGLKVSFFSEEGEVVSILTALYGEINYASGMMLVRDSVVLFNIEKKQRLTTSELFWNQNDSTIYTDQNVQVTSPKGTLYGKGIRTKQDFTYYEFLKPTGLFNMKE
jgi:LPS export ABC transporter protein LptC